MSPIPETTDIGKIIEFLKKDKPKMKKKQRLAIALETARKAGAKISKPKKRKIFTRVTDRRMKDAGEIDYAKKKIRVNPRKLNQGGITDTVVHEELHRQYPDKTEKDIRKMTKRKLKKMSLNDMGNMLKKFREKKKTKKRNIHYKTD